LYTYFLEIQRRNISNLLSKMRINTWVLKKSEGEGAKLDYLSHRIPTVDTERKREQQQAK